MSFIIDDFRLKGARVKGGHLGGQSKLFSKSDVLGVETGNLTLSLHPTDAKGFQGRCMHHEGDD